MGEKKLAVSVSLMFLCMVILVGCVPPRTYTPPPYTYTPPPKKPFFKANYDISLSEVERPAKAKNRYGEQKLSKIKDGEVYKYYFEDDMVKILWLPLPANITFILENKTNYSIKIIWDDASFVDTTGGNHRVMHSGVKFSDRNNPQPPSVVIRKGRIDDLVYPSDYTYYRKGHYSRYSSDPGGWEEKPLFPVNKIGGEIDELKKECEVYIGKTIQVLLPMQIEDVVNDYIFTFRINSVEVKQVGEI
jgi:hypothetical protein